MNMAYKDKQKEKEYQAWIPIELKRLYQKRYYSTDKGREVKRLKNKRYRDNQKLSLNTNIDLQLN